MNYVNLNVKFDGTEPEAHLRDILLLTYDFKFCERRGWKFFIMLLKNQLNIFCCIKTF